MPAIAADALEQFITNILSAAGTEDEGAAICANHLVNANLKGHDSHGVGMLPSYIAGIQNGEVQPNAHAAVIADKGAILTIDGQRGLGQVVTREAVDIAIDRVRATGLVCMALRNATHIGRIGTYAERIADAGFVSVHFVNVLGGGAYVVPWGGREPRMITNPFCCAVPRPDGEHIVLDMATSTVAAGKVRVAMMKDVPLADGILVDEDGNPTNDPHSLYRQPRASLTAFGQHKGSGLMLMCELLGGAMAGNQTMQPGNERTKHTINNMLTFVIDPEAVPEANAFDSEVAAMTEWVRATPTAAGHDAVLLPGDPERASRAQRLADGVDVDENTWQALLDTGASVKVTWEE